MKTPFLLRMLITSLGLMLAGRMTAQTFTTLYSLSYNGRVSFTSSSGPNGLLLSGNTLYGTARQGGYFGDGTVFAVNTDGTNFGILEAFDLPFGDMPLSGLVLSSNTLYGTTLYGGDAGQGEDGLGYGTVFVLSTDSTYNNGLYGFTNGSDGAYPYAGLVLSGNTLYGTTVEGGSRNDGTIFAINTNGTGFTVLHSFAGSDGANPAGGLLLSGDTLYGTTSDFFGSSSGTVFSVNTDGTNFTTLYRFTATSGPYPATNSDGAYPYAGLILSGDTLYGTAERGGISGNGTVFKVNTNGGGFTTLHSFTAGSGAVPNITNSDGANPQSGLVLSGNTLYGTAYYGGSLAWGTVFAVNTDGKDFTTLHAFSLGSDGAAPQAGLVLSGNMLYGTASEGGTGSGGTVFALSLPPPPAQLCISEVGTNAILTWPTNYAGLTLQSTTSLVSPALWTAVSPAPVVVSGQETVTNPISGTRQFFRLSQ